MGYFMAKSTFVAEVTLDPTLFVTRTRLGCCYGKKKLAKKPFNSCKLVFLSLMLYQNIRSFTWVMNDFLFCVLCTLLPKIKTFPVDACSKCQISGCWLFYFYFLGWIFIKHLSKVKNVSQLKLYCSKYLKGYLHYIFGSMFFKFF